MRSGAPIDAINTVRKRLSRIKGGRLAVAAWPAPVVTLAVSDVPGDDPAVIASGPTVPAGGSRADALAVIERHGVELPPAARAVLADPSCETPDAEHPAFAAGSFRIVAKPADAILAACEAARALGYEPVSLGADVEGEAREVAAAQAAQALALKRAAVERR